MHVHRLKLYQLFFVSSESARGINMTVWVVNVQEVPPEQAVACPMH